jgi:hypothetical protein
MVEVRTAAVADAHATADRLGVGVLFT